FEGAGRDVSGVSPWLLSYAQPLQDRSRLAAGPALAERAWEQYLQGLVGGMVRDPVTGQLVPTNEMQLALGLSWLASATVANQGQPLASVLETIFGWQSGAGTSAGQGQTSGATAEDLSSSAKAVLAPETGEARSSVRPLMQPPERPLRPRGPGRTGRCRACGSRLPPTSR